MSTPALSLTRSLTPAALPAQRRVQQFLMCPPQFFRLEYAINSWMDLTRPIDSDLARAQWAAIYQALLAGSHDVALLTPHPDAPDMVFAANGAVTIGSRALGARFAHRERALEAPLHRELLTSLGVECTPSLAVSEGEGDFIVSPHEVFAGHGFRCEPAAHRELAELTGVEVVSLRLVDPRFYHLDTALLVLDADHAVVVAEAFDLASLAELRARFADVFELSLPEALAFGANSVVAGTHLLTPAGCPELTAHASALGFEVVALEVSELIAAGGAVKCCVAERWPVPTPR